MNLKHTLINKAILGIVDELETINKNAKQIEEVEVIASKLNDELGVKFDPAVIVFPHVCEVESYLRSFEETASQLKEKFFAAGLSFIVKKDFSKSSSYIEFYIEDYAIPVRIFRGIEEFNLAS